MAIEGPIGRSAGDLGLLLSVQAGYDPRVPLSIHGGFPDPVGKLGCDLAGRRIGWLGDLGGRLPFEAGILELCREALSRLGDAGVCIEPLSPPVEWERIWRAFVVLRQFSLGGGRLGVAYDDPARRRLMKPELQWEIEQSRALSVAQVQRALLDRTAWLDQVLGLFAHHDYLALPSAQVFPFPIEWNWPREIAGHPMDSYHRWMEVVTPGTLSGCPVISLPAGFGPSGLPMGVQVIGRPREELSLLQLAHAFEQVAPWMKQLPPAAANAD